MSIDEEATLIFQEDYAFFLEDQVQRLIAHASRTPTPAKSESAASAAGSCSSGASAMPKCAGMELGTFRFSCAASPTGNRPSTISTTSAISAISTASSLSSCWASNALPRAAPETPPRLRDEAVDAELAAASASSPAAADAARVATLDFTEAEACVVDTPSLCAPREAPESADAATPLRDDGTYTRHSREAWRPPKLLECLDIDISMADTSRERPSSPTIDTKAAHVPLQDEESRSATPVTAFAYRVTAACDFQQPLGSAGAFRPASETPLALLGRRLAKIATQGAAPYSAERDANTVQGTTRRQQPEGGSSPLHGASAAPTRPDVVAVGGLNGRADDADWRLNRALEAVKRHQTRVKR